MNKTYKPQLSCRKERKVANSIRSPAFQKKFQGGMPRINKKAIPFHNLYDVEINTIQVAQEKGYKFWGCLVPQKRYNYRSQSKQTERRVSKTRGETMLSRYMKRRPSLTLTPRENQSMDRKEYDKKYDTLEGFGIKEEKNMETTIERKEEREENEEQSFLLTMEEISNIGNKSLYQMTPKELEISIIWKKKFLQFFKRKIQTVKKPPQKYFSSPRP